MFSITITDKSGTQRRLDFDARELTIGRVDDNHLVLPKSNVSKQHARLVVQEDRYVLSDLQSTNGTYVNGRRIGAPAVVRAGDKIYIGDFILGLGAPMAPALDARASSPSLPAAPRPAPSAPPRPAPPTPAAQAPPSPFEVEPELEVDPELESDDEPITGVGGPPSASGARTVSEVSQTSFAGRHDTSIPPGPQPAPPQPQPASPTPTQASRSESPEAPMSAVTSVAPRPPEPPKAPPASPEPVPAGESADSADRSYGRVPASRRESAGRTLLTPALRLQVGLATLMQRLGETMEITAEREGALGVDAAHNVDQLLDALEQEGALGTDVDRRFLREAAIGEIAGLGPLDALMRNEAVREVVVDHPTRIVADMGAGLAPVSSFFSSAAAVLTVVRRLFARADCELTDAPSQTVLLPDGTHVRVLLPPLAPHGAVVSLQRPLKAPVSAETLVSEGVLSAEMLQTLRGVIQRRDNLLVTGPPGRHVPIVCAALAGLSEEHERIVALHGGPRVAIAHPQTLSLCRLGAPAVGLAELLEQADHLRFDRLVIDELIPGEALPLLTLASGRRGLILGAQAPSPAVALGQLQWLAQAQQAVAPADLLGHAVQWALQLRLGADGALRVDTIAEVDVEGTTTPRLRPAFRYEDGRFRQV